MNKKPLIIVLSALLLCLTVPKILDADNDRQRSPYDHVFRVSAKLAFDGQEIVVDELIDCTTDYPGPANRAVTLPFETSRWQLPFATDDGGVLVINIMPNTCAAFAEEWAGVQNADAVFPDGWAPFMHWYNARDPLKATAGEYYWSAAALAPETGRLKIVENFEILYPDQSDEVVSLAAKQVVERDVWIGERPRLKSALLLPKLPVYYRLPRDVWANEPAYRKTPDRPSDVEGLRAFLDQLPDGDGIMLLGEDISSNQAWGFTVGDHLWGRRGGTTNDWHGVPQRGLPRWGMFLSARAYERAQTQKWRVPFRDDWVPTDIVDGVLSLRPEKKGIAILKPGISDWYFNGQRRFDFLDKPIVNGPYTSSASVYVFDLETRDLWVRN